MRFFRLAANQFEIVLDVVSAQKMVTHDERILDLVDKVYRLEEGILIEI